jgi:hypothetical protein
MRISTSCVIGLRKIRRILNALKRCLALAIVSMDEVSKTVERPDAATGVGKENCASGTRKTAGREKERK